jgi:hypothetical protein
MDYKKSGFCSTRVTFRWQTSTHFLFCSLLRSRGTHLAHTQLMPNSTVTIWWTLSNDTFKLLDNSLNDNLLSFSNCSALTIFTTVTAVLGLPLRASSTTHLFPSLKCFHHQNTVAQLIASVPYAFCNISYVSSPLFPSFTQNSIAHLWLKTYEISFCSAIAKQVSYSSSYKHTHATENDDLCTSS